MRPGSSQPFSYRDATSLPRRATAFVFALAISGLIVIMLLNLGARPLDMVMDVTRPIVVQLLPEVGEAKPQPREAEAKTQAVKQPPPPPMLPVPHVPLKMLILSPEEFAASDISKLSRHPADTVGDISADAGGEADEGLGQGPGGERLYNAEWYRKPSDAELATYLPQGMAEPGWAMIACRTVEHYRVEDCQELAESPPGSGLSRALRQAAWQFLVRPPRIGGKAMVGEWVRIRFDFSRQKKG